VDLFPSSTGYHEYFRPCQTAIGAAVQAAVETAIEAAKSRSYCVSRTTFRNRTPKSRYDLKTLRLSELRFFKDRRDTVTFQSIVRKAIRQLSKVGVTPYHI
jgi:hypothetical protein